MPSVLMTTFVPSCSAPSSTRKCVARTPESASLATRLTVTFELFQLGGAVAMVDGGVRSMLTAGL